MESDSGRFAAIRRLGRWVLSGVALVLIAVLAAFSYCEHRNAAPASFPGRVELQGRFSRAANWIVTHRDEVLSDDNPMLWLFVREAARLRSDPRLTTLTEEYLSSHPASWEWNFMFDSRAAQLLRTRTLIVPPEYAAYQRLLIYGATCNESLRNDPEVTALLDGGACHRSLEGIRSPWCRTHQLMGLLWVQRNQCEPAQSTSATVTRVQDAIRAELDWDFRVEDAYIQKVMMLSQSGRRQDVKAIWLRRILDSQRADGGWDGVDTIGQLPANPGRVICWTGGSLYPRIISAPPANFHATAQGLYLTALWLSSGQPD